MSNLKEHLGFFKTNIDQVSTARTNSYRYKTDRGREIKLDIIKLIPKDRTYNLNENKDVSDYIKNNNLVKIGLEDDCLILTSRDQLDDKVEYLEPPEPHKNERFELN